MGNRICTNIKVDYNTAIHARGKFARLCVEVDLEKQILGMLKIKDKFFIIEYEGLYFLYDYCGKLGHKREDFLVKKRDKAEKAYKEHGCSFNCDLT